MKSGKSKKKIKNRDGLELYCSNNSKGLIVWDMGC